MKKRTKVIIDIVAVIGAVAINIANEDIESSELKELQDKEQTIYIYCRSGNRSKQEATKLAAMGYTNIVEFGGIID